MSAYHIGWKPAQVPAAPLLTQLSANALGKVAKSTWPHFPTLPEPGCDPVISSSQGNLNRNVDPQPGGRGKE